MIQEFPDPADDDVLYLESPQGEVISRDDPDLVLHYREVFEELRALSLGPDDSVTFLTSWPTRRPDPLRENFPRRHDKKKSQIFP